MSDWDAARYDRVSEPQFEWGRRVIAHLAPRSGERILDLGCGTGRLTVEIAAAVPGGLVLGLDRSEAMLTVARRAVAADGGPGRVASMIFVRGDGGALPFAAAFDAVFSTATLHWIADHDAVFHSVFESLRRGGRFVAQCGGGPNLQRLYTRAAQVISNEPYSPYFRAWREPWHFALPEQTRAALNRAGFVDIDASLEAAPATFRDRATYAEFIGCVCLRHHLERLPPDLQRSFVSHLTASASADDPPLTLDYWRLNIRARRAPASTPPRAKHASGTRA